MRKTKSSKNKRAGFAAKTGVSYSVMLSGILLVLLLVTASKLYIVESNNDQDRVLAVKSTSYAFGNTGGAIHGVDQVVPSGTCAGNCGIAATITPYLSGPPLSPQPSPSATPAPGVSHPPLTPVAVSSVAPSVAPTTAPVQQQDQNLITMFLDFINKLLSLLGKLLGIKG